MARDLYSRRQILAGGVGAALAYGMAKSASGYLGAHGHETIKRATEMSGPPQDLGAIEHVIFLMHENRSFDHYFGTLGGVRGFDDRSTAFAQAWPDGRSSTLLPFHLNPATQHAECTYDLSHSWQAEHDSWNNGAMDRFVATHTSTAFEGPQDGVMTMGYYEQADLPFYYELAKQFTICDGYHCSVLGPTHPNRMLQMTGTLDPAGEAGGPILVTNTNKALEFTTSWTTMPEVLDSKGISWKVYNPYGHNYTPGGGLSMIVCKNVLMYFEQYSDPTSTRYKNAFGYYGPDVIGGFTDSGGPNDFAKDVMNNELPAVSWLIPPDGYDEHPPAPPALGEWYTQQILDTLLANPTVWASTALFIMYDENDGFFDHVAPPTAPPGTPGEYITAASIPAGDGNVSGPIGLGVRVPMIVVSPFSTGGYVCHDTFDHTSQLRLLETLFGATVPNLSSWRRSVTGDLTAALPHTGAPNTTAPTLPVTSDNVHAKPILRECTASQILETNPQRRPYPIHLVPRKQKAPTQARGTLTPTPT